MPRTIEAVIVDFIAGACTKLSIAVQELDSEAIARAILAASWRGVHVELFLEQDYLAPSVSRCWHRSWVRLDWFQVAVSAGTEESQGATRTC